MELPLKLAARALLLAAALALAACARAGEPAAFEQTQRLGALSATLTIAPDPPLAMRQAELRLALRDADGRPLSGASLRFDLDMPGCLGMPPNRPQAAEVEPGLYAAPALFSMAGYWRARVLVTAAGEEQAFTFYLGVE